MVEILPCKSLAIVQMNFIKCPLRGYCTPTRKLACFVCFLLHREENQYFLCMVVIDVCVSKSKSMIFFPWIYNLSCGTVQNIFFLFNLRNHFKINRINSCFYYRWNHPFSVQKYIPMLKSFFTWLDLVIWSWPLLTIGDSNAPKITQNMYFFKYWLIFHDCNPFHMLRRDLR